MAMMIDVQPDALEAQVLEARRTIASDGYPMSIGELTNLYRDKELIIRPEFQRFFRWTQVQKSRLIESLLLGIPLPSIFVAQQEEGKWELVDGLQRVSTILELQGELRDQDGDNIPPLELTGTKYLPALEGRRWEDTDPRRSLSNALRLDIKRAKIDVKIIKRESSPQTKYDLFQRLNSYGSTLTDQEMRSALLAAVSPEFLSWLENLASYPSFVEATQLSERLIDERYDLELVLKFIVLHNWPQKELSLSSLRDFPRVLDDKAVALAIGSPSGDDHLASIFKRTFDVIIGNGGEVVLRRWDPKRNQFGGSFLNSAFEIFALGLGYHIAQGSAFRTDLVELAMSIWSKPHMSSGFATGRSTEARLLDFVPMGRKLLRHSKAGK
jgi:hypothetical protein